MSSSPALLALALLAGCGSETTEQPSDPRRRRRLPGHDQAQVRQTTIKSEPKRIVVVGLREQDALLALGIVPVGTTEWYGEHPGAIFPWAKDALGDAKRPTVLSFTDGIQYEQVAALRPT